jgi:anhydro-N-acetylmuramic acid kinase
MRSNLPKYFKSVKWLNILGVNSGTSADGLDLTLVRFSAGKPEIISCATIPFEQGFKNRIISAGEPSFNDGAEWLRLDAELGQLIGEMTKRFIGRAAKQGNQTDLIAMHGQTVRHLPHDSPNKITHQIGDAARVAAFTGIPVVSDFRRSDTAAGGDGAPLSPILHESLFRHENKWRAILNIGGISNVTVLPPKGSKLKPFAADCGPGNMMIDRAMQTLYGLPFDRNGDIASKGNSQTLAVQEILADPFFTQKPPKSTGRELFGQPYLEKIMALLGKASSEDIIATLAEITVRGITDFVGKFAPGVEELFVCGGGAHNVHIMNRIGAILTDIKVTTTAELSFDPDYIESILWAFLAWRFIKAEPVSARNFTGAKRTYIPGKLCLP